MSKMLTQIRTDIKEIMMGLDAGIVKGEYDHDTYLRICGKYQGLVTALGVIEERSNHDEDEEVGEVDEFVHS